MFVFYHQCLNQIKLFLFFYRQVVFLCQKQALTQLKPPINVFSNNLACSALVGNAIPHLFLYLCTQPLNEMAELHFQGLYLKISFKRLEYCSNILHSMIVLCKIFSHFRTHPQALLNLLQSNRNDEEKKITKIFWNNAQRVIFSYQFVRYCSFA